MRPRPGTSNEQVGVTGPAPHAQRIGGLDYPRRLRPLSSLIPGPGLPGPGINDPTRMASRRRRRCTEGIPAWCGGVADGTTPRRGREARGDQTAAHTANYESKCGGVIGLKP